VNPIALTGQGTALQAAAQGILDAVQAARDEVAAFSGQVRGTATLGSTSHTGRLDLACVLADIREHHPGVIVKLRQSKGGSEGLVHAVRDGSVDIALTGSPNEPPQGITLHQLFREPMMFICLPGHPLSRHPPVTVPELRAEMILRSPPGWGTRTVIDDVLGATQSAFEITDYALMARLVRDGFATTLAPESAISGEMLAGLRAVVGRLLEARLHAVASAGAAQRVGPATGQVRGFDRTDEHDLQGYVDRRADRHGGKDRPRDVLLRVVGLTGQLGRLLEALQGEHDTRGKCGKDAVNAARSEAAAAAVVGAGVEV